MVGSRHRGQGVQVSIRGRCPNREALPIRLAKCHLSVAWHKGYLRRTMQQHPGHKGRFYSLWNCPSTLFKLVRARHLRQHPSRGRIVKRTHAGGPRATCMESEAGHQDRRQRNQTALISQRTALLGTHDHVPRHIRCGQTCAVASVDHEAFELERWILILKWQRHGPDFRFQRQAS